MKAKLIKTSNGIYDLFEGTRFISTTDSPDGTANKLSLKNCQAIERGYDLDELAKNIKTEDGFAHGQSFIAGFQKALELMGDKKFSETNLEKAFDLGKYVEREDCKENYQAYKQSLQQTEWDVEIEIEEYLDNSLPYVKGEMPVFKRRLTLDADGCLILKKVKEEPKQGDVFDNAITVIDIKASKQNCEDMLGLFDLDPDLQLSPKQETLEEAGAIAAGLCEHLEAKEQAMFIAGFQECAKWQAEQMEKLKDFDTWKQWKNETFS